MTRRIPPVLAALVAALLLVLVAAAPSPAATAPSPSAAPAARPPRISAASAVLVEPSTGDVVYARRADQQRLIASTTKLMTALVALKEVSLDDVLTTVAYHAAPAESIAGFSAGERVSVRDLLRALLVTSANDAAATLAARASGSRARFVDAMNREARRLGLRAHFTNPIGLDAPGNHASAEDLVKLALVLRENPFLRATVDRPKVTLRTGAHPRTFLNRNLLVRDVPWVDGVKTGHTNAAGYILVGSATRNGVTLLSAVLGEPSEAARDADSLALLKYGLARYHEVTPVTRGREIASVKLRYRDESVGLLAAATIHRTARRGEVLRTRVTGIPGEVDGPLPQGARVGAIEVLQRGKVVAQVPLVTAREVTAATTGDRLRDFGSKPVTLVLLAAFLGGSLLLVLLRRRTIRRRRGPAGEAEVA